MASGSEQQASSARGARFWITSTLLAILLLTALGAGSFLLGQSTRPSDEEINGQLDRQERKLRSVFNRRAKRAGEKAAAQGREEGFGAGQAQGFGSGQEQGKAEGTEEGKRAGRRSGKREGAEEGFDEGFEEGTCYHPVTLEYVC